MKIHYFQHVEFEGLGLIADWAEERGYSISATKFYENYKMPNVNDYDLLVIMGGSMSVKDTAEYEWLEQEKEHIRQAIKAKKPILGVCLGAQLIADVLGAKVSTMPAKEIGWFPIAWRDEAVGSKIIAGLNPAMNVLHWHGEQFEIPNGAVHLASSKDCANQAFLYGDNVLGLQFHLEMDEAAITGIIKNCGNEIAASSATIQPAKIIKEGTKNIPACQSALFKILDGWAKKTK